MQFLSVSLIYAIISREKKTKIIFYLVIRKMINTKQREFLSNMKKGYQIITIVLAFFLAACGNSTNTNNNDTTNRTTASQQQIENKTNTINTENNYAVTQTSSGKNNHVTKTTGTTKQIPVKLVRVIDGDTIKVNYQGQQKTLRYLLIDTPETKKPGTCIQPYGKDAFARNKQLVSSGELSIEFDVGQRIDKYGRLLAYVYVDNQSVQEILLKEGLARVGYIYPPNTRYLDQFQAAEKIAKKKTLNVWRTAGYVTSRGFSGCTITGKSTAKVTAPTSPATQKPKRTTTPSSPTVFYKNCRAVRTAGAAPIRVGDPGYSRKLDRDGDGIACE